MGRIELTALIDFLVMFIFAMFGVLFSLEKTDGIFRLIHIIIISSFSASISFGVSYYMYVKYGIELDNRIMFTASSIVGFAFEHFSIQQIIDGARMLRGFKITFKNNKKGGK